MYWGVVTVEVVFLVILETAGGGGNDWSV
jgi:hypothetical protein